MALLNQRQLATAMRVSRATIITWTGHGLPVVAKGGPGKPTLYDFDGARAWCARTGRGFTYQSVVARAKRESDRTRDIPAETFAPPAAEALSTRVDEESQAMVLRLAPAVELALICLPGVLRRVDLPEEKIDRVVEELFAVMDLELERRGAADKNELLDALRSTIEEERKQPGSWTT